MLKSLDDSSLGTGARYTRDELGGKAALDGTKYGQQGVSTKV